MRLFTLCAALLLLAGSQGLSGPPAKSPAKNPPKAPPKGEPDYARVEIRGTLGSGSEMLPNNPFQNPFLNPPTGGFPTIRSFVTIKVNGKEGWGEWRLDLDEAAENVLRKSIGKQVTITGYLHGQSIDVKTVNGLDMK